jgi:hypothetical protein
MSVSSIRSPAAVMVCRNAPQYSILCEYVMALSDLTGAEWECAHRLSL